MLLLTISRLKLKTYHTVVLPFHLIRSIPDWPKSGIEFKDWNHMLAELGALRTLTDLSIEKIKDNDLEIDFVVGAENRGFMLGATIAQELGVGFVPLRKPGKTPPQFHSYTYNLEYGKDTIELAHGVISPGSKVLVHDDLLATGGTAFAAGVLVEKIEANLVGFLLWSCLIFRGEKSLKINFRLRFYPCIIFLVLRF